MKIDITDLQNAVPIDTSAVRRAARVALEDISGCYSVVFVDDEQMCEMNRKYLGRDYTTDVIAFPFEGRPLTKDDCAGEIIVSAELAAAEAKDRDINVEAELALYVVHGLLHLTGFDDAAPTQAAEMHRREKEILAQLGYDVERLWKPLRAKQNRPGR